MEENSIEETKKQLELILKVRKEQKEIIECAGGSCMNCDPDIKALSKSIEILSDYKRVLKENEELKESNRKLYEIGQEMCKQDKYTSENYIPVQKVKDKMKKDIETNEHIILGGRRNGKTLEYGKRLGRIEMCQELLEGRK